MNILSKINPSIDAKYLQTEPEGQYFERKSARIEPKDIIRIIISFANANGGVLAIGIEDDGTFKGFKAPTAKPINSFLSAPREFLYHLPSFEWEELDIINNSGQPDKILLCHIESSVDQVYKTKNGTVYLRIGDKSAKQTNEEINALELKKGARKYEDIPCIETSIDDIDLNAIKEYQDKMNTSLSPEELLKKRHLITKNGQLTIAGLLLFGKDPGGFFPAYRVRFVRYDGIKAETGSRLNIIKDQFFEGPIPTLVDEVSKMILSQLRDLQILDLNTGQFQTIPEYPRLAWFEGMINAITHRDYSYDGEHIRITMYDNRLEIHSPGGLPGPITIKNMHEQRYSRNPHLARVLFEFGWVRELGEGVRRIYEEMDLLHLNAPKYSEPNNNSVLLILENNILSRDARSTEKLESLFSKGILKSLNQEELVILDYLQFQKKITTKRTSHLLDRSSNYAKKRLESLLEKNLILWSGSSITDPKQYYYLNLQFKQNEL